MGSGTLFKTLQDNVPGFSGERAKSIVTTELGRPYQEIFQNFSDKPLAAASLGQVHTAFYKREKVAIKVQRKGLKELFDVDLKNLKKLAVLFDKFDPKTDWAGEIFNDCLLLCVCVYVRVWMWFCGEVSLSPLRSAI